MKFYLLFLIILSLVLNSLIASAREQGNNAFVILKAKILDEERTIKNICLHRKNPCTYLNPSKSFSEIRPGRYHLLNIDFTDNELTGRGNLFFDETIKFRFKKNRVYFIGELQLSERKGGKYKMKFEQDIKMLSQACRDMPERARKFPLANATTGKEIQINCSKILGNDA